MQDGLLAHADDPGIVRVQELGRAVDTGPSSRKGVNIPTAQTMNSEDTAPAADDQVSSCSACNVPADIIVQIAVDMRVPSL